MLPGAGKPVSSGGSAWRAACGTYEPRASMKMNVFRMLLVCFFQELLLSSSLRPISSRVEAGNAARKRRRREVTAVVGARMKNGTTRELAGFRMPNGLCLVRGVGLPKRVKFCAAFTTHKYWS